MASLTSWSQGQFKDEIAAFCADIVTFDFSPSEEFAEFVCVCMLTSPASPEQWQQFPSDTVTLIGCVGFVFAQGHGSQFGCCSVLTPWQCCEFSHTKAHFGFGQLLGLWHFQSQTGSSQTDSHIGAGLEHSV